MGSLGSWLVKGAFVVAVVAITMRVKFLRDLVMGA